MTTWESNLDKTNEKITCNSVWLHREQVVSFFTNLWASSPLKRSKWACNHNMVFEANNILDHKSYLYVSRNGSSLHPPRMLSFWMNDRWGYASPMVWFKKKRNGGPTLIICRDFTKTVKDRCMHIWAHIVWKTQSESYSLTDNLRWVLMTK